MIDREKVIKGLETCTNRGMKCNTENCPYWGKDNCLDELQEDALELLKSDETLIENLARAINDLGEKLRSQPQIVRCKDCKHSTEPDENGFCVCMKIMHGCQSWGFCADGERRTDDA